MQSPRLESAETAIRIANETQALHLSPICRFYPYL
jgi:hypothetical protein